VVVVRVGHVGVIVLDWFVRVLVRVHALYARIMDVIVVQVVVTMGVLVR
jgi:hypothetical protein